MYSFYYFLLFFCPIFLQLFTLFKSWSTKKELYEIVSRSVWCLAAIVFLLLLSWFIYPMPIYFLAFVYVAIAFYFIHPIFVIYGIIWSIQKYTIYGQNQRDKFHATDANHKIQVYNRIAYFVVVGMTLFSCVAYCLVLTGF